MKKSFCVARPLWLAAASCVFSSSISAQTAPFELRPVTVTGSGMPRTLGSEIAATSVLTRGDIERSGARDMVQVLNLLGTALVEQQGGAGTLASVRIRGADSRDTLVLVDGVPLTDLTSGQALLQQVPADIVERVEVVRGNLSALYGANATGGVIQVFTRRAGTGGWQPQVGAGVGSQGTRSASASLGGGSEVLSARVAVGHERTEGFSAGNTPNANPDKDGNERDHAVVSIDAQPGAGHRLGLELRYIDGTAMYDAPRFGAPTDTHEQRLVQSGATLRGTHGLGSDWTVSWRYGESTEKRTDTEVSQFGGVRRNTLRNDIGAVELGGSPLQGLKLQAALEQLKQSTSSTAHLRTRRDTDVVRVGGSYESAWGAVQANLRHDRTNDFGSASTGLLGGRVVLGGGFSLLANAATSFTPPTFDFLYFDCGGFACSNPDLRPERARTLEGGAQWQDENTLARATLFAVRYRDKIANDANFVPQNLPRVRNNGLELSLRHAVGAWTWLAEATFQDPKDEDTGERPLRRTRVQAALRVDFHQARWHAGAGLRHVGSRPDTRSSSVPPFSERVVLPSYVVADASAHWSLRPDWTLSARIDNLFDKHYEPTWGYNGRPRGVFVGLQWSPRG